MNGYQPRHVVGLERLDLQTLHKWPNAVLDDLCRRKIITEGQVAVARMERVRQAALDSSRRMQAQRTLNPPPKMKPTPKQHSFAAGEWNKTQRVLTKSQTNSHVFDTCAKKLKSQTDTGYFECALVSCLDSESNPKPTFRGQLFRTLAEAELEFKECKSKHMSAILYTSLKHIVVSLFGTGSEGEIKNFLVIMGHKVKRSKVKDRIPNRIPDGASCQSSTRASTGESKSAVATTSSAAIEENPTPHAVEENSEVNETRVTEAKPTNQASPQFGIAYDFLSQHKSKQPIRWKNHCSQNIFHLILSRSDFPSGVKNRVLELAAQSADYLLDSLLCDTSVDGKTPLELANTLECDIIKRVQEVLNRSEH